MARRLVSSIALVPAISLALAGCAGSDADRVESRVVRIGEFTIAVPRSWGHDRSTTLEGGEQLEVYSGMPDIQSEDCERGRSTVIFHVSRTTEHPDGTEPSPRPRHFDADSGTGLRENVADLGDCGALSQWIPFTEDGESYAVDVTLGQGIKEAERTAAYEVLDSLRVGVTSGRRGSSE